MLTIIMHILSIYLLCPSVSLTFSFAADRGFGGLRCGGASWIHQRSRGGGAEAIKHYAVEEVLA